MSKKIRIHCDAQALLEKEKTGIGWCIHHLIQGLCRDGDFAVTLNYFSKGHPEEEREAAFAPFQELGAEVRACPTMSSRFFKLKSLFFPASYRALFGGDADVSCFLNYYMPRRFAGKSLVVVYDMVARAFPKTMDLKTRVLLKLTLKSSLKRADRIVTISEFSKSEIVKYYGTDPDKISVLPMGVDCSVFKPEDDGEKLRRAKERCGIEGEYFMYLGTLEPRKNIESLVGAYAVLTKELKPAPKLVIAGKKGWLYEDIFRMVERLGLTRQVIFTGYLTGGDNVTLLSGAKAFVFPSLYEGFGMPPLEAMACGAPVIVSKGSSLTEVTGDAGLSVAPGDIYGLAQAMKRLAEDEALRRELIKKGLERAKRFTWEASSAILKQVIQELHGGKI